MNIYVKTTLFLSQECLRNTCKHSLLFEGTFPINTARIQNETTKTELLSKHRHKCLQSTSHIIYSGYYRLYLSPPLYINTNTQLDVNTDLKTHFRSYDSFQLSVLKYKLKRPKQNSCPNTDLCVYTVSATLYNRLYLSLRPPSLHINYSTHNLEIEVSSPPHAIGSSRQIISRELA